MYKVKVIKMVVNGGVADFGDILPEENFIDLKDSLERGYIEKVDSKEEATQKEETKEEATQKEEVKNFAKK